MPYCIHCGTSVPSEARFCSSCGKAIQPGTNDKAASGSAESDAAVIRARRALWRGAVAYVRAGSVGTPLDSLDFDELRPLLALPVETVDLLVRLDLFSETEKLEVTDDADSLLVYLDLLSVWASQMESQTLSQGAFWLKAMLVYSEKQALPYRQEEDWSGASAFYEEYLDEARATGAASCLLLPLARLAEVKLKLGDRASAGGLLDELDRALSDAGRETLAYPFPGGSELFAELLQTGRRHAVELRRLI